MTKKINNFSIINNNYAAADELFNMMQGRLFH